MKSKIINGIKRSKKCQKYNEKDAEKPQGNFV